MRLAGKHAGRLTAALLTACVGCSLELPSVCGDGHIDDDTELCDPAIDDGPPCDPVTCTLIVEPACGNGKLDPGEPCDNGQYASMQNCPSGKGYLQCTADCQLDGSKCNRCGDGILDDGEECDPNVPSNSFTQPTQCSDLNYPDKPYTSGQVTYCIKDTCKWYRGPCGYCGDDDVDPPSLVDPAFPKIENFFAERPGRGSQSGPGSGSGIPAQQSFRSTNATATMFVALTGFGRLSRRANHATSNRRHQKELV